MKLIFGILILWQLCGYSQAGGYDYPKPNHSQELVYQKPTRDVAENMTESGPPPGVQGDFIDDLITEHKQQILLSILGGSKAPAAQFVPSSEGKAFQGNKCASCTCGVPNINRIVGGSKVKTNKYPWIAQVLRGSFQFCGATLINDRYALTAAHCVHGMDTKGLTVRLLQLDKNAASEGILRKVSAVNMHRQYSPATLQHDIALLKLDQPVPLKDPIRPICLPITSNHNFDFKPAIVAGWGLTSDGGSSSNFLREVTVPVITNAQCRATSYSSMIVDTMLCAGYLEGGKDACQGDSGGPLIVREGIFRLAGVVSFGYGCASPDAPGVYTRVSKYLDWIAANTRDACYCVK
ncbi:trypsin-1 [Musca domestica]|uniref:Trypsin-1 n=2 Tax=Musca domestica TaxID=7370 RepID=A0A9J7DIJ3_MUSDO|nr:trypsin-1-like [Musca domestica]XP_058985451.1 trypsin-1 [Musca domestica]